MFNPWDEVTTQADLADLADLFLRAGVPRPAVTTVAGQHHLEHPDQFWDIVVGSGYRATTDALSPGQQAELRDRLLRRLRADEITALRTDVIYGIAQRPE
jgi:hypothetical protein